MAKKKETETKTGTPAAVAVIDEPKLDEVPIPKELGEEYDKILEAKPEGQEKEPEPEVVPEPEPEPVPEAEPAKEEEDIPDRLVEAGRAHGYTDAKIIKLAEDRPGVLEDLARDYERIQSAAAVKKEPEKLVEKPVETGGIKPISVDTSRFDDETSQVIKTLVAEVNKDREIINKLSENVSGVGRKLSAEEARRQDEFDLRIDNVFDSVTDVPQFGKKSSLTSAQQKARLECHVIALALAQNSGGSVESLLPKAIKAYRGMYGVGESPSATLRAKLNKSKTRFTARPGGQRTQPTYATEEEKGFAAMDEAGKAMNIWK